MFKMIASWLGGRVFKPPYALVTSYLHRKNDSDGSYTKSSAFSGRSLVHDLKNKKKFRIAAGVDMIRTLTTTSLKLGHFT